MSKTIQWVLMAVGAIVLLPIVWKLFLFALELTLSLLHLALVVGVTALVVIFFVGLIRRLLVAR